MTETKQKFTVPGPVPVDAKKLIDGLGTIFGGVVQILAAAEPGMAKALTEMALKGVPKENAPENVDPDDFEEILSADDLPWDTDTAEPEQAEQQEAPKEQPKKKAAPKKQPAQTELSPDDLIRVVTQKIKKDRNNKEKILALLKSYGAAKVSDIPPDKYEAFLTDVSQL